MININNLKLIGKGATSDVFQYQNDKIIKLFNSEYNIDAVNYEAEIAKEITKSNIKAPKYIDKIEINNRYGIIYEYIPGKLIFEVLLENTKNANSIINQFVKTQIDINNKTNKNLPDQCSRLSYLINRTDLLPKYKNIIISSLQKMPVSDHICHGDFHVGNIIYYNNEFYTIDWMNSYKGNIESDVLRSYLMLISPYIPFKLSIVRRIMFMIFKRKLGVKYLKEYKISKKVLRKWWPIIAAARLSDNVPNEKKWLMRKIALNIKYLTTAST